MNSTTETDFYNKVARKFGDYSTGSERITECPDKDPEEVFKTKLLELGSKQKTVLDVGCADGRFTLSIAPYFKKVVAIDMSDGMLRAAKKLQKAQGAKNVSFEKQDAFHTDYPDNLFDVIFSRRGPTPFNESFRLLKSDGYFVEIDIGEQDCREIKEVFGRGQGFGTWGSSRGKIVKQRAKAAGFEIVFVKDYFCNEYYPTYQELDLFLQGVPIFEDFDSERDRKFLKEYTDKFTTRKGIKLARHRVVSVLHKPKWFL